MKIVAEIKSINGYKLNDTIARENIINGHEPTLEWFYPQVIRTIIDNGKKYVIDENGDWIQ